MATSDPRPPVRSRTFLAVASVSPDVSVSSAPISAARLSCVLRRPMAMTRAPYALASRTNITNGPQADDGERVAGNDGGFIQAPHHASQRLDQRSVLISHVGRDLVHISFDNSGRNADVLGVSAVVEKKIVTKVFVSAFAVEAFHARSRVSRYYALPYMETFHFRTHGDNIASQFVPK